MPCSRVLHWHGPKFAWPMPPRSHAVVADEAGHHRPRARPILVALALVARLHSGHEATRQGTVGQRLPSGVNLVAAAGYLGAMQCWVPLRYEERRDPNQFAACSGSSISCCISGSRSGGRTAGAVRNHHSSTRGERKRPEGGKGYHMSSPLSLSSSSSSSSSNQEQETDMMIRYK